MIDFQSLNNSHYFGQAVTVNFDIVTVNTSLNQSQTTPGATRGSFAVMLRSDESTFGVNVSTTQSAIHTWNKTVFYVLRLKDVSALEKAHINSDSAALSTLTYEFLGAFYKDVHAKSGIRFAGDIGDVLSANNYGVFSPSPQLLRIIVNGCDSNSQYIHLGLLRQSETNHYLTDAQPVFLSMLDIRGKRSAMFGKTRLGKSNVVKLLVQGMLDATAHDASVGQLIFDVNGEYANDNSQDGGSIASSYADRCLVYFLSRRNESSSGKLLRFNLYERTEHAFEIMRELLPSYIAESSYVRNLLNCRLPALTRDSTLQEENAVRQLRKIMLFWAILDEAGFDFDELRLTKKLEALGFKTLFNPCFSQSLRLAAYHAISGKAAPHSPHTFREMIIEMTIVAKFALMFANDPNLIRNGNFVFDHDELIMARFLIPDSSEGPYVLRPCVPFHSPHADNFIVEILHALHAGKTVVVDLGSANEQIIRYFAKTLSTSVFKTQEEKFVNNQLNHRFIQIYFEEAHMIFPLNSGNVIDVYSRFAKEGAKFNIGIVYSTQSPSTVNHDLLAQTENFFIGHLSSVHEATALAAVQYAFKGSEEDIMRSRTPGFMRMLSYSNRYLIPFQANRYTGESWLVK